MLEKLNSILAKSKPEESVVQQQPDKHQRKKIKKAIEFYKNKQLRDRHDPDHKKKWLEKAKDIWKMYQHFPVQTIDILDEHRLEGNRAAVLLEMIYIAEVKHHVKRIEDDTYNFDDPHVKTFLHLSIALKESFKSAGDEHAYIKFCTKMLEEEEIKLPIRKVIFPEVTFQVMTRASEQSNFHSPFSFHQYKP